MGELEAEEPSGENLDRVGRIWGASGIWEASGKHLGGIRDASGRHPGAGKHVGSIWDASGKHLGGIWEASGRHLGDLASVGHLRSIWEASTLGFPPWSERCLLETPGAKIRADHQCMFLPVCFLLVMCWTILGNCMGNNNGDAT